MSPERVLVLRVPPDASAEPTMEYLRSVISEFPGDDTLVIEVGDRRLTIPRMRLGGPLQVALVKAVQRACEIPHGWRILEARTGSAT